MTDRSSGGSAAPSPSRSRCRCGHLPTHHMVVLPIGTSDSFRLDPSGPCAICGEGVCRHFAPGGV
ncbi:MAG TPA: hypothetical protein VK424_04660 [Thermoplasmata archaeon]|nr:hypothetical protein [Thermoplasmata archaeon]